MTTKDNVALLLSSLEGAIRQDRRFFVAAQADPVFSPLKTEVEGLLTGLLHGVKAQAQKELTQAQSAFAELKAWHGETGTTNAAMAKLQAAFKTGGYFGYLDTLPLAREAKTSLEAALQAEKAALKKTIEDFANKVRTLETSVGSFLASKDIPIEHRGENVTKEYETAKRNIAEAQRQMRTERYENCMEAMRLLTACERSLGILNANLNRIRLEIWEKSRHLKELADAFAEKQDNFKRLNLAILLLFASSLFFGLFVIWAFYYDMVEERGTPPSWFSLVKVVIALLFLSVPWILVDSAIKEWNILTNEPGSQSVDNTGGTIFVATIINAFTFPILALLIYVRGRGFIKSRYREKVEAAERLRRL